MATSLLDLLDELGRDLVVCLHHREPPHDLLLSSSEVLEVSMELLAANRTPTPREALAIVASHWAEVGVFAESTHQRLGNVLSGFTTRLDRLGVTSVDEESVTPSLCEDFLHASVSGRGANPPSPATMHLRRSALRAMFSSLRVLMLRGDDPTLDLHLPPRVEHGNRPVTTDERDLLRLASVTGGWATSLRPAAVALAEAGAWPGENAAVRIADLLNADVTGPLHVRVAGSARRRDRIITLSEWGSSVVRQRARTLVDDGAAPTDRLTYNGNRGPSGRGAAVGMALSGVFRRAGLSGEPDRAPKSLVKRAALDLWDPHELQPLGDRTRSCARPPRRHPGGLHARLARAGREHGASRSPPRQYQQA